MPALLPFRCHTPEPGNRTVWVIRHGRTTANAAGIVQSWSDFDLDDLGRAQTAAARDWFADRPVDLVVSSPLARARSTMHGVFGRVDEIDVGWGEQASPGLAGLFYADLPISHPEYFDVDVEVRAETPRGEVHEHLDTVTDRALTAAARTAAAVPPGGSAAVCTHGAVIAALVLAAGAERAAIPNLAVLELIVDPTAGWRLVSGPHHPAAG